MASLFEVGYTKDNCPFSARKTGSTYSVVVVTPKGRIRIEDLDPDFDLHACLASELLRAYSNTLN